MSTNTTELSKDPFLRFVQKAFDRSTKSQRQIAEEAGYTTPNIVSMIKTGVTKLPLDRVPALAKALDVDPAQLFRLALGQFYKDDTLKTVQQIFGTIVSDNERELLEQLRALADGNDPTVDEAIALLQAFKRGTKSK